MIVSTFTKEAGEKNTNFYTTAPGCQRNARTNNQQTICKYLENKHYDKHDSVYICQNKLYKTKVIPTTTQQNL